MSKLSAKQRKEKLLEWFRVHHFRYTDVYQDVQKAKIINDKVVVKIKNPSEYLIGAFLTLLGRACDSLEYKYAINYRKE